MYHNRNNHGHTATTSPATVKKPLRDSSVHNSSYGLNDILKLSPALGKIVSLVHKISGSDISVLLTGESGVGKEVFARAIHQDSKRRSMPFIPVNCGALPETLVESTLFGHEKGSFTGAITRAAGKCREADGGVLFLDEVGELKPDAQVKLLRMLQQGEIEPVGSGRPVKVDVRVIAATNRNLEKLVARGQFREDLYYRMRGLPLHIPPLRERRGDIAILAENCIRQVVLSEQLKPMHLSPGALTCLTNHDWPGNVRELQHVVHRAALLAETDRIEARDILPWMEENITESVAQPDPQVLYSIALDGPDGRPKTLDQIEQEAITVMLARYNSHVGRTAAALGIGQSTLYSKLGK